MTTPAATPLPYDPKTRDLAEKIYLGLVTDAVKVTDSNVGMTTDPANLAKISFKLSAAFLAVEQKLNEDNLPKNVGFKVGVEDIASWSKT
jgi:hypothetical protein